MRDARQAGTSAPSTDDTTATIMITITSFEFIVLGMVSKAYTSGSQIGLPKVSAIQVWISLMLWTIP